MNEEFLSWDDTIEEDGEFTLLEPGDYDFEVVKFERAYTKSNNAPMAVLSLKVSNGLVSSTVTERIVLMKSLEWKLSQFFRSIGQKKHGEKLKMDWSKVVGSSGRCEIEIDSYTGADGKTRENNRVKRFYDPDVTNDVPEPEEW